MPIFSPVAADSAIFQDSCTCIFVGQASASDSFTAHDQAHSYVGRRLSVAASDSFGFTEQVFGGVGGGAADSATFTDAASSGLYLGRFRRGDSVPLGFSTPVIPDAPPIAIVLDSNSAQVYAAMMPAFDRSRLSFTSDLFIGLAFSPGSFQVYYHSVINGTATLQHGSFDVVSGGDSGGAILSMYSLDRSEVMCVIAQLEDGHLVLGRNPATTA